jgi:hypothetical protein
MIKFVKKKKKEHGRSLCSACRKTTKETSKLLYVAVRNKTKPEIELFSILDRNGKLVGHTMLILGQGRNT